MRQARRLVVGVSLLVMQFALLPIASAQGGTLDPSFGGDGKVTTAVTRRGGGANAVAIQTDGRIVVSGTSAARNPRFALARYNTDGSLDTTFGGDGAVTTDFRRRGDRATALAIQSDGKVVVAGNAGTPGAPNARFALARYNTDGRLDPSFGGDGRVTTDLERGSDVGFAVVIQVDGKIVVAGNSGSEDFALARYNTDGSLDPTFGGDGKVITSFGQEPFDTARSIDVQTDGRIVVAGGSRGDFALSRYNADGSLDTTFGEDGKVTSDLGLVFQIATDVTIQGDGKIVAAGWGECFQIDGCFYDVVLARYNPDGTVDTTFGEGGRTLGGFEYGFANAVVLQPDGKLVTAGTSTVSGYFVFALARFDADGALDADFGTEGRLVTGFTQRDAAAGDVAIQADEKIVAAGVVSGDRHRFAVTRFLP